MTWDQFLKGIKTATAAFGRRMTTEDAEANWDLLSFIPDAAWLDLCKLAVERWETWPRNVVMAYKDLWYSYQGERAATYYNEQPECPYCHDNSGIIFVESLFPHELKETQPNKGIVRCGHCRNWQGSLGEKIVRMTVDEIREKGYRNY